MKIKLNVKKNLRPQKGLKADLYYIYLSHLEIFHFAIYIRTKNSEHARKIFSLVKIEKNVIYM